MLVNCILAAVCVYDNLIEERLVSALADILINCWEEPESVVCSIAWVACFLSVDRVLVVLVRASFVACLVVELNKWKSAAVIYLCRDHKSDLFSSKLRIDMDNTLDILNCISIAIAVSQTAIDE